MDKNSKYLLLSFLGLVLIDLMVIVFFFYKAQVNFPLVFKHIFE